MGNDTKQLSRKKFLSWGLGISSLLAIPAFFRSSPKKKETRTATMLTQDGKLVTIEIDVVPNQKKKINSEDIHTWVTTKKSAL